MVGTAVQNFVLQSLHNKDDCGRDGYGTHVLVRGQVCQIPWTCKFLILLYKHETNQQHLKPVSQKACSFLRWNISIGIPLNLSIPTEMGYTPGPLYNTVCYNTDLDITLIIVGPHLH